MSSIDTFDKNEKDNLNVDSVDDFFNNIPNYEENFNFMQNNENAFYFARKRALENNNDSSTNDDFEDEVKDDWSEVIISADAELEITRIPNTNLFKCVIMNLIDRKLQR